MLSQVQRPSYRYHSGRRTIRAKLHLARQRDTASSRACTPQPPPVSPTTRQVSACSDWLDAPPDSAQQPIKTTSRYGDRSRFAAPPGDLNRSHAGLHTPHLRLLPPSLPTPPPRFPHHARHFRPSTHTSILPHPNRSATPLHCRQAARPLATAGGPTPTRRGTVPVHTSHAPHTGQRSGCQSP